MTKITRVTIRETDTEERGRKLVVQLLPKSICIWPKGTTANVYVTYDAVYALGLRLAARREEALAPKGKGKR